MDLQAKRQDILRIAAKHGARNIRVFGSAARGDDRLGSDLDLLVEMELENLLHRKVDVVTDTSVHPAIRPHVLADARPL
jgi:uncharacterized protein